jgi:hypothetical protein
MFQDKLTREIAAAAAQIKTEPPKNEVNSESVEGAVVSVMTNEELKGNQHKIDANKNGKVDAHDFKLLRAKKGKTVEEGIKGAGIGAAVGSVAGGPIGAAVGGALGHVAGEVLSSAKNKTKAMYRIAKGPSMADSKIKKEEVEELDELFGKGKLPAIAAYHKEKGAEAKGKMETIRSGNTKLPVPKSTSAKIFSKDAEAKYHSTQEKRAKSLMKKEEVESVEEGFGDLVKGIKRVVAGKKSPSAVRDAHLAKSAFSTDPKVKEREGRRYDKVDNFMMKKEETELDEAFPTVADARKRMAAKESGFEKKKISTGTVYSRKYKAEPEENDEAPKKKAKTMKEMLSIYSAGGAEALVENLMIEEPSQDEYKKEVETAQAKADGKIRNDKGIAKAASQGVKMEEVEIEVLDADEINGVQIDNIEERHMTDAEMDKREEIVKSMKKGIQGFKDRYGDKAKNVMYATATKLSKKD